MTGHLGYKWLIKLTSTKSDIKIFVLYYDIYFLSAQPDLILILELALNLFKYFKQTEWNNFLVD